MISIHILHSFYTVLGQFMGLRSGLGSRIEAGFRPRFSFLTTFLIFGERHDLYTHFIQFLHSFMIVYGTSIRAQMGQARAQMGRARAQMGH